MYILRYNNKEKGEMGWLVSESLKEIADSIHEWLIPTIGRSNFEVVQVEKLHSLTVEEQKEFDVLLEEAHREINRPEQELGNPLLECPFCSHRWVGDYDGIPGWESCPKCRGSFCFNKPKIVNPNIFAEV
jgi:hypothetical protein